MKRNGLVSISISLVGLLVLLGCAQLGLEPARSFEERLAYAVSQNAAVRIASARSLDAGDIKARGWDWGSFQR